MTDIIERIISRVAQWLPNSHFTIPFELITVFQAVNDVWDGLPFVIRAFLTGAFAVNTLFIILRMLF